MGLSRENRLKAARKKMAICSVAIELISENFEVLECSSFRNKIIRLLIRYAKKVAKLKEKKDKTLADKVAKRISKLNKKLRKCEK